MNAMTKVAVSDKNRPLCAARPSEPSAGQDRGFHEVQPEELTAVAGGTLMWPTTLLWPTVLMWPTILR